MELDLHGIDEKSAEVELKRFINMHYELKSYKVVIITGKGTGVIQKMVKLSLSRNKKQVEKFEHSMNGFSYNLGSFDVYLKKK